VRIALASCRTLPEPDPDQGALLEAIRDAGALPFLVPWEDHADYGQFGACVIRSTWNYVHHLREFLDWARRVAKVTTLLNPLDVVLWNTDKGYLRYLEARGIPVVPTEFVPKGGSEGLRDLASRRGWSDMVVKPRVGAASFATARFGPGEMDEGERFLRENAAGRAMMVQPYLRSVEDHGERAMVWIAGEFTHGVAKSPRFGGSREAVSGALDLSDEEKAFGEKVLGAVADRLLYARVDTVRLPDGRLAVMELELVEPSLFLVQRPEALRRFARACVASCRGGKP
jgi:hypothetical protein